MSFFDPVLALLFRDAMNRSTSTPFNPMQSARVAVVSSSEQIGELASSSALPTDGLLRSQYK